MNCPELVYPSVCICACGEEEGKFFMEQFEPSNLNKEPCIHTKECER